MTVNSHIRGIFISNRSLVTIQANLVTTNVSILRTTLNLCESHAFLLAICLDPFIFILQSIMGNLKWTANNDPTKYIPNIIP